MAPTTRSDQNTAQDRKTAAPELLQPTDQLAAGDLIDRVMRPGTVTSMMEDFPRLVGPGAPSLRMVVREEHQVVAHAAAYVHDYRLGEHALKIGVLGAIATDPQHRGRGYATRLIDALVKRLSDDGIDLILLWSQADALYERLGFVRAGREQLHLVWPLDLWNLPRARRVRLMRPDDLVDVSALHAARPARTERDLATWQDWRTLPGTTWYVLDDGGVAAYGVVGKGHDLKDCLHEWGGDPAALPVLASGILAHRGDERLIIMSAPDCDGACAALSFHDLDATNGALGMIKIPDAEALATKLGVDAEARTLTKDHRAFVTHLFGTGGDDDARPGILSPALYLTGLDSM